MTKITLRKFKHCKKWKPYLLKMKRFSDYYYIFLIFLIVPLPNPVFLGPAKITLFKGLKKGELFTKQCRVGMQLKNPVVFTCSCITGVWGFYSAYCTEPVAIAGGDGFCFKMANHSISQLIPLGNPDYPFEPSLSILTPHFTKLLGWVRSDNVTSFHPGSAFLTVSNTPWTLHSEKGDSLCLKGIKGVASPKRNFCLWDTLDRKRKKWGKIVRISKGCNSHAVLRADNCGDIKPPNDVSDCTFEQFEEFANSQRSNVLEEENNSDVDEGDDDDEEDTPEQDKGDGKVYIDLPDKNTVYIDLPDNDDDGKVYIDLPDNDTVRYITSTTTTTTTTTTTQTPLYDEDQQESPPVWIQIQPKSYTSTTTKPTDNDEENPGWIQIQPKLQTTPTPTTTVPPTTTPNDDYQKRPGWIRIQPKLYTTPTTTTTVPPTTTSNDNNQEHPGWIKIQPKQYSTPTTPTTRQPSTNRSTSSSSSEEWIPIKGPTSTTTTTTTTPMPEVIEPEVTEPPFPSTCDDKDSAMSRDTVKKFWLSPENNQCSRSLTEAIFTDQLRRFTVKQLNEHIFDSRLKSLHQMEHLLNLTKEIMLRTCSKVYVPPTFFNVAFEAFITFVREDFFYGVEPPDAEVYPRVVKSLEDCLLRVSPHAFEHVDLDCGIKKINGYQILPGKKVSLNIPKGQSHKNYEVLIETSWKMFLNAHSFCFQDFHFSNDHHHFAILMLELFTKSIWEKWIEPPTSLTLYSFILPNFQFLEETMDNVDYCVAGTGVVSSCPVWLDRSSAGDDQHSIRKKRSIWVDSTDNGRGLSKKSKGENRETLGGEAYCLQDFDDQESKLGLPQCSMQNLYL